MRALARGIGTVLNFELGANPEIVRIAARLRPLQATLVPERRKEITTEGGLRLGPRDRRVRDAISRLTGAGVRVSLFIDPEARAVDRAVALGVPAVELHTGRYAHTWRRNDRALGQLRAAARHARAAGLAVHAGHGLTYDNVQPVAAIAEIEELNIGHTIVSSAMQGGVEQAVRRMRHVIDEARQRA
jgi:pyridoxine 5-phosphate synthase